MLWLKICGYPVDCGKWIEVFLFSPSLHYTNSKIFVLKISVLEVTVSCPVVNDS